MAQTFRIIRRNFCRTQNLCIKHVSVIGGGIMGSGIAQVIAQNGIEVSLVEQNSKLLKKSEETIIKNLREASKTLKDPDEQEDFVVRTLSKITGFPSLLLGIRESDLIIEAIPEKFDLKSQILAELDLKAPEKSIIVSNTSSISINQLSDSVNRKDKFAGLHFLNPAWKTKLVEICRSSETSEECYEKLKNFCGKIDKTSILVKDAPGFIVNHLLGIYVIEALRMYERGDADFETIDLAVRLGLNTPMGPFQILDHIGLDTALSVMKNSYQKNAENNMNFEPSKIVEKMVSEGKLGVKSGEGFYTYQNEINL